MLLRKNGGIEKNWNSFVAAPPGKNKLPFPYPSETLSKISAIVQPPRIKCFKKNLVPPIEKGEGGTKNKV